MAQNLPFKLTAKDRLFYGRFEYSLGFYLPEANCLRELDHERIDINIDRRREYQEMMDARAVMRKEMAAEGNPIISYEIGSEQDPDNQTEEIDQAGAGEQK